MRNFLFSLKINWLRVAVTVTLSALFGPFLIGVFPAGGAAEQAWLDQVVARIEQVRDATDDEELRDLLDYTARRYRKVSRFNVQIRHCGPWTAGLNIPHCPGVTIDPEVVKSGDISLGVMVLVHEARHDYFPYWGHYHFDVVDRLPYEI